MAGEYEHSGRGKLEEGAPADFIVISPKTVDQLMGGQLPQNEIRKILGDETSATALYGTLDEGISHVIKSGEIVDAEQNNSK